MNQTQFIDANEQNVVEFGDSPGRRLRVQRQSRGLTIERIGAQLHLKPEIIDALEQDRFEDLPDGVFVMGYLRNYARLLGLDPIPLIASYRSQAGAPQAIAPNRALSPADGESGGARVLVRLVSFALLIAVIAMIALWWHDRSAMSPELASDPIQDSSVGTAFEPVDSLSFQEEADPLDSRSAGIQEQTPDGAPWPDSSERETALRSPMSLPDIAPEPPIGESASALSSPPILSTSSESAPAASAEPVSVVAVDRAAEQGSAGLAAATPAESRTEAEADGLSVGPDPARGIALEFTGPSWVQVSDAAGTVLLIGEMKAGERREVSGQTPLRFTIGRAANTRMTVDGAPFDLEERSKGGVARFSFDPESSR
jgi:cytoskeleton protein RodZ